MALYISREGDITAVDTKTQLTTQGSVTAPGALIVPAGAQRIAELLVAFAVDSAVLTAAQVVVFIRLEGNGTPFAQNIMVGASGGTTTTSGSSNQGRVSTQIPVDIPVIAGNTLEVWAEMAGVDPGTVTIGVTMVFV